MEHTSSLAACDYLQSELNLFGPPKIQYLSWFEQELFVSLEISEGPTSWDVWAMIRISCRFFQRFKSTSGDSSEESRRTWDFTFLLCYLLSLTSFFTTLYSLENHISASYKCVIFLFQQGKQLQEVDLLCDPKQSYALLNTLKLMKLHITKWRLSRVSMFG